jgi:hypothetical protein
LAPQPPSPTNCPDCTGDITSLIQQRKEIAKQAKLAEERAPRSMILINVVTLEMCAILFIGVAIWFYVSLGGQYSYREAVQYFGGSLICLAFLIQLVAYGLVRGRSWARLATIAFQILSVFSILFPLALVSLILLLNNKLWTSYVRQLSDRGSA